MDTLDLAASLKFLSHNGVCLNVEERYLSKFLSILIDSN